MQSEQMTNPQEEFHNPIYRIFFFLYPWHMKKSNNNIKIIFKKKEISKVLQSIDVECCVFPV